LADTERDGHRLAFNRAFAEAELGGTVQRCTASTGNCGGKERIRFYLNNYRPDFELPAILSRFIAELHAAKPSITNNW